MLVTEKQKEYIIDLLKRYEGRLEDFIDKDIEDLTSQEANIIISKLQQYDFTSE